MSKTRYETRGVLAGAYRASDPRSMLSHAVRVDEVPGAAGFNGQTTWEERVLCDRVKTDSMVDTFGAEKVGTLPTCKTCARKLAKVVREQ